jgi:hypothetical protein
MRRAGAIDLRRRGTAVGYDSQQDEFFISPAAVAPIFPKPWKTSFDAVVRYFAAGGVAMRILTDETSTGENKDLDDLCDFCNHYCPQHAPKLLDHWKQGQAEVEKDLQDPKLQQEIWCEAAEFEKWLRNYSK